MLRMLCTSPALSSVLLALACRETVPQLLSLMVRIPAVMDLHALLLQELLLGGQELLLGGRAQCIRSLL